jgi:hypothetical protein
VLQRLRCWPLHELQQRYRAPTPQVLATSRGGGELRYLLEVVTTTPDEAMAGRGIVRLTLLAMKHGRGEQLRTAIFDWEVDFRIEAAKGARGLHNIGLIH